ncbi:hypothetical protein PRK78_003746 [Emydomyces testavorans]|uniref:Peptidase metallopeptidase domain-containing protein n=1 Tax=Emydomyces testavorans TaxID=2070801 RepID=A0AAF0DHC5_9EURO|nr:hypothetical protein PRK78_003746 [Emydomyces testavorans]
MAEIRVCTVMPIPPELQAKAASACVKENPRNAQQITTAKKHMPHKSSKLALPVNTMWADGRTLRVRLLSGSDYIKSKIKQYATKWTEYANIKLQFVESGDAEIRVRVNSDGTSWSYVGSTNLSISSDNNTMNFGWLTDQTSDEEFSRVVTHEFGHALGCIHEHQSPAANIKWNKQVVYDYYEKLGWSKEKVDFNIFDHYSQTTTQYSDFDSKSIMLYSIPKEWTTDGFSVGWNTVLSDTDKAFIADMYPKEGADTAYFNTMEVRPWYQPSTEAVKRVIFPKPYSSPPGLAIGLNWLDVDHAHNVRVNASASNVRKDEFDIHLTTWDDTKLYSAGCSWLEVAANDKDFQIGEFSTEDDHPWNQPKQKTSRSITFPRAYNSPPQVLIWMKRLDLKKDADLRASAYLTDITATSFTIHINTWGSATVYSCAVSWIAYPSDKKDIASGTFSTREIDPWESIPLENSGQLSFNKTFQKTPKVLLGLRRIDVDGQRNLRIKLSASSISKTGMTWHIDSWGDTLLNGASGSYIALG